MAIDAGYKITPLSGKNGTNGQNGASLSVQYSIDGTSNWHNTFASGDIYMRQKLGDGSWSSAMKIVGEDGDDGTSPYSCSVSNENFTVATGTNLKPLSATTYSVKFQAYKGSTQLSPIAPSAAIASGKFKVSTPTASGFTVAQSTAGTLTFTTATGTAISANLTVSVTVTYDNGSTETKVITISASKTGNTGNDSYSCEISASAVSVSTGTDRKPTAAGSVNIVFKAFKGTTALSAVASSSSTVSASQFRVTTPTSPQGGLTITQSTNGTLNIAWATGTAIDATRSIAVTVAIGSTSNTVTKTITISASIKGGTGSQGSRAIRYIGKSATKPNSSNQTSGTPVSGITPIVGDWYLCTTDGYVYYCTAISGSNYTWAKITSATDYRLLSCVDDLIVLHQTVTTNTVLNTAVDNYTSALAVGTLLANKIFTNSIKLSGSMIVIDKNSHEVFRIQDDGFFQTKLMHTGELNVGTSEDEGSLWVAVLNERNPNNSPCMQVGIYNNEQKNSIFTNGIAIQAYMDMQGTVSQGLRNSTLYLQKYGGNIVLGSAIDSSVGRNSIESYMPIFIPAVSGNYYDQGTAKVLGVIRASLDLNSSKYKGTWHSETAYEVGDIVTANSDYMRCITEHKYCGNFASSTAYKVNDVVYSNSHFYKCKSAYTSTSTVPSNDTTHWTDMGTGTQNQPQTCVKDGAQTLWISATQSGYIVFSNGLCLQWGKKQQSDSTEGMRQYFPIHFTVPPIVTANSNSQDGAFRGIQECTTTYFKCDTNSGYSNKKLIYWIAIGY